MKNPRVRKLLEIPLPLLAIPAAIALLALSSWLINTIMANNCGSEDWLYLNCQVVEIAYGEEEVVEAGAFSVLVRAHLANEDSSLLSGDPQITPIIDLYVNTADGKHGQFEYSLYAINGSYGVYLASTNPDKIVVHIGWD